MIAQEHIKTISKLREWLINYELWPDDYHLPGDPPEMTATILIDKTTSGWSVYYREPSRGTPSGFYEGSNEAEACQVFLSKIMNKECRIPDCIEMEKNLLRNRCSPEDFSFDGTHKPNSFILKKIDSHNWLVYFWDGSIARNIRRFTSEHAACYCLGREIVARYHPIASRQFPPRHDYSI